MKPLVCGALALAGCSGTDVLNAFSWSAGYKLEESLAYGDHPRQMLDLYTPEKAGPDTPTIVFFYGGSWQSGDRSEYRFLGSAFARQGFRVAVPDYRLYPEARFPDFLEDSAAAVAWLRKGVASEGKLFLMGHSAGAYNAAMLALAARWLEDVGASPADIDALALLAGPYDFLPLKDSALKVIFGPEETRERTQPINHVSGAAPPMLLLTGEDDETVLPRNSKRLADAIREAGGDVAMKTYSRVGHLSIIGAIGRPLRMLAPVLDDVSKFFLSQK